MKRLTTIVALFMILGLVGGFRAYASGGQSAIEQARAAAKAAAGGDAPRIPQALEPGIGWHLSETII